MIVGGIKKNNAKDFECFWPGRQPDYNNDGLLGIGAYSGLGKDTIRAEAVLLFRIHKRGNDEGEAEILSLQCADDRIVEEAYQALLNSLIDVMIKSDIRHISFNIPNRNRYDIMNALVDSQFTLDGTDKRRYEISRSQFLHTYLEREELTRDSIIEVYSLDELTDNETATIIKNVNRKAYSEGDPDRVDIRAYDRRLSFIAGSAKEPEGLLLTEINYEGDRKLTVLKNYGKNRKIPFVLLNELCSRAANILKDSEAIEVTALAERANDVITQYFVGYSEYEDIEGKCEIDY